MFQAANRDALIFVGSCAACSNGLDELCHLPGTESACGNPHVVVAIPVLILGRAELCSQGSNSDTGGLIDLQWALQESPGAIDHLSSGLAVTRRLLTMHFVGNKADIIWRMPFPLAIDLCLLLAMSNLIAQHTRDLAPVDLGSISV